jgi:uncharacterized protein (DUF433 family)
MGSHRRIVRRTAVPFATVRASRRLFEGCYEASRAAALAGVPVSTVYDWARKQVVVPTVSQTKPKLWSYADLVVLRIVYWLRHAKAGNGDIVPASPMTQVRGALDEVDRRGIDLWSIDPGGHRSSIVVDRRGRIVVRDASTVATVEGQGILPDSLDLLGPFDVGDDWGPDLRRPMPHLRIVPGKLSGEPHIAHSRLMTQTVAALARRGFTMPDIQRLYPTEDPDGLREAVELEQRLAA